MASSSSNRETPSSRSKTKHKLKDVDIPKILDPFYKQEKVIFNRFDLTPEDPVFIDPLNAKHKKNSLQAKLAKALKLQEKLQKLPKEKANEMKHKASWQAALNKAQGVVIKDDPNLLKKSIKKKKSLKKMHTKKWNERTQKVQQQRDMMKKKKQKNIERRRELKKKSKNKGSRKSHNRP